MEYFCRQPRLYGEFMCTGDKCPDNCCHNWGHITWTDSEYNKLVNADCSEELRQRIGSSFKRDGKNRTIKYGDDLICPFQTKEQLCMIQKELGAEYLSSTCQVYPRNFYLKDNSIVRTLNSSCYHVMEMLINKENIMELTDKIENIHKIYDIRGKFRDIDSEIKKNPVLEYRMEIFEFLYDIVSDKSLSLETALTLGALAAQQISKMEEKGQYDKIPKAFEALKSQLNDPVQIKKIDEIKPNYTLKFNFVNNLLGNVYNADVGFAVMHENGRPSKEKYDIGNAKFEKAFENRPFAMRNIALNILMECFVHFYIKDKTLYENYCYIVSCLACIKLTAIASFFEDNLSEELFTVKAAYICRKMFHVLETPDKMLKYLKDHNCTSPAHLALLIK